MKLSQSNFKLRSPDCDLVRSYLQIATVQSFLSIEMITFLLQKFAENRSKTNHDSGPSEFTALFFLSNKHTQIIEVIVCDFMKYCTIYVIVYFNA